MTIRHVHRAGGTHSRRAHRKAGPPKAHHKAAHHPHKTARRKKKV